MNELMNEGVRTDEMNRRMHETNEMHNLMNVMDEWIDGVNEMQDWTKHPAKSKLIRKVTRKQKYEKWHIYNLNWGEEVRITFSSPLYKFHLTSDKEATWGWVWLSF